MTRRIYGLLPDADIAHRVVAALRDAGIDDSHIHVVARPDKAVHDLPEAGLLETSDVAPAAVRGAAAGAVTGALAGLGALVFPPAGLVIGGGLIAATTTAGAGFGAWVSSMIGISRDSNQIEAFELALDDGQILMMVDLDSDRIEALSALIAEQHPDVELHGLDTPDGGYGA